MGLFGVKGPKQLLASAIASALSEYFEVDDEAIESNLLKDAKIVLKKVRLRPQITPVNHTSDSVVVIHTTGSVEEVSFKWTWVLGNSNEKMWMKDITFTMKGLEFKMQLSIESIDTRTVENPPSTDSSVKNDAASTTHTVVNEKPNQEGRLEAYIRNQVEQIIDALTLIVSDFKFTLILPKDTEDTEQSIKSSGLEIRGKQLELRSLGRQEGSKSNNIQNQPRALIQQLYVGSFCIGVFDVYDDESAIHFPVLSPISYEARAIKQGGKRFESIGIGLTFEGEILQNKKEESTTHNHMEGDSDIVFHAGTSQIRILSHLGNLILAHKPQNIESKSETKHLEKNDTELVKVTNVAEPVQNDMEDRFEALKNEAMNSSVFKIPISSISLILPNDTKMSLQSFTLNYHADGTVLNLKGADGAGITVDGYQLIGTKCDESNGIKTYWMIDFTTNRFSLETNGDYHNKMTVGSQIKVSPEVLKQVFDGLNLAIEATGTLELSTTSIDSTEDTHMTSDINPSTWFIDVQQNIEILLEKGTSNDSNPDWVKINVNSPSIMLPFSTSSELKCAEIIIGPCSRGDLLVQFPRICQDPNSDMISFDGMISIVAASSSVLTGLIDFANYFSSSLNINPSSNSPRQASPNDMRNFPMQIQIPSFDVKLLDEAISLNITDISVTTAVLKCREIIIQNTAGISLLLKRATLVFSPTVELSIGVIESLHVPGALSLLEPIIDTTVLYHDDCLKVKLTKVVGLLLNSVEESEIKNDHNPDSTSPIIVPMIIDISFGSLLLKRDVQVNESKERQALMSIKGLTIGVEPNHTNKLSQYVPFHLSLDEAKSNLFELYKIETSTLINVTNFNEVKDLNIQIAESVKLYAQHSMPNWPGLFLTIFRKRKEVQAINGEPLAFPNVHIDPMQIHISYKFSKLTNTDTDIHTSAFNGDPDTTVEDIIQFYKKGVINQVPGVLHNTNILGVNVVKTTLLVGQYSLAPAGVLIGIVGGDAIKSNLRAGREKRGGKAGDNYKVGDLIRGVTNSVSRATQSGVAIRSGSIIDDVLVEKEKERKGNIIDYTVGVTSGTINYLDKNKAKLACAGAASAAMIASTVLLGPIGTVASAAATGALTEKVIKHQDITKDSTAQDNEKNRQITQESIPSSLPPQGPAVLLVPQGLLFKRKDIFNTKWTPWWFILDVENRILNYHIITKNAPTVIDVNVLDLFKKPASHDLNLEEKIDFQLESQDNLTLSTSKIEISKKFTNTKHNLFAFTITTGKNTWYLAAMTAESRQMWVALLMDLSGLNTCDDILSTC